MDDLNVGCKIKDLRIVINVPSYWGVIEDGSMDVSDFCGEGDADIDNFDSYQCDSCGELFADGAGKRAAWTTAVAHVSEHYIVGEGDA